MRPRRPNDVPVAIVLALALFAQVARTSSETPAPLHLPVSESHIRQALAQQTWLRITLPTEPPTYRVEIREHRFFIEEPYTWNFGSGRYAPRYSGPPLPPSSAPALFTVKVWHSNAP